MEGAARSRAVPYVYPFLGGLETELLYLAPDPPLVPAERAGHGSCHPLGCFAPIGAQLTGGEQPKTGATEQHVADGPRLLVAGGMGRLGQQVRLPGQDRLR
jgi:hypothetical protein